jgi:hypothetical protein
LYQNGWPIHNFSPSPIETAQPQYFSCSNHARNFLGHSNIQQDIEFTVVISEQIVEKALSSWLIDEDTIKNQSYDALLEALLQHQYGIGA